MNKTKALLFLLPCLLAACHCGKTSPSLTRPSLPAALTARADAQTSAAPVDQADAQKQKTALQETAQNAPALSAAPAAAPGKTDGPSLAAGKAGTEASSGPKSASPLPQAPTFTPAPDKAVFEDEKLIDFKGRLLHPYAALPPDPHAAQNAPWAYEQLKYGVYYSFIKAGTAYIRNRGIVSVNGRPAYLLQTTAFSASVIDAFFKVRDVNQSWLDAENFYSLGYGQSVREGSYKRDEWVIFDYERGKYSGQMQKKEAPRPVQGPLDIKVLDILTALYYLRAQELEVGRDFVFDVVNREKQYPLVVKVLKKEKVKTAAGTFDCILVEPQLRGEGIFVSKGKSLKVWLTDDEYKMPVKMKTEVFIGSVSAELLSYQRQQSSNIL